MTHMLNPTLVKLNIYDLSQLWLNSKWILLDRENIREFPELSSYCSIFFSWINVLEYFSFQAIPYRDHILSCNDLFLSESYFFLSHKYPVHFLSFFQEEQHGNLCLKNKNNNQYFKFYSISPLGRNKIIFYINFILSLGRNEINVWKTQKNFKTIYLLLKIKSSHWFKFN